MLCPVFGTWSLLLRGPTHRSCAGLAPPTRHPPRAERGAVGRALPESGPKGGSGVEWSVARGSQTADHPGWSVADLAGSIPGVSGRVSGLRVRSRPSEAHSEARVSPVKSIPIQRPRRRGNRRMKKETGLFRRLCKMYVVGENGRGLHGLVVLENGESKSVVRTRHQFSEAFASPPHKMGWILKKKPTGKEPKDFKKDFETAHVSAGFRTAADSWTAGTPRRWFLQPTRGYTGECKRYRCTGQAKRKRP